MLRSNDVNFIMVYYPIIFIVKSIIENKDIIQSIAHTPKVVLLSDGAPTDDWKKPLNVFEPNEVRLSNY